MECVRCDHLLEMWLNQYGLLAGVFGVTAARPPSVVLSGLFQEPACLRSCLGVPLGGPQRSSRPEAASEPVLEEGAPVPVECPLPGCRLRSLWVM